MKLMIQIPCYNEAETLEAVSYTHLDVYKRQVWAGKAVA